MKRVDIIAGQFGWLKSYGLKSGLGFKLDPERYEVHYWHWHQHREIANVLRTIDSRIKRAIIGMSLGGNACSWIPNDDAGPEGFPYIDLIVAYDPSKLGELQPIGSNVKRCFVHRQMGYLLTSAIYGRATFTALEGGPRIEENRFYADHLAVSFLPSLHTITRKLLEEM
jgi:hypothetical protein